MDRGWPLKIAVVLFGAAALFAALPAEQAQAEFVLNLQGAGAFTGYNDVRIPPLAASQGRAGDVLIAVVRDVGKATKLFAGYRILEGGADNDEVYTFSLFHYVVLGVETRF